MESFLSCFFCLFFLSGSIPRELISGLNFTDGHAPARGETGIPIVTHIYRFARRWADVSVGKVTGRTWDRKPSWSSTMVGSGWRGYSACFDIIGDCLAC